MSELKPELLKTLENEETLAFEQEALSKKVDLQKDELVIHGTFIENLESILKNGLGGLRGKRQYAGYGQSYSNSYDYALPWEDETGAGLYFSRINNATAFVLHNYAELPSLTETQKLLEGKTKDEKTIELYNKELQKALTKYFQKKELVSQIDKLTFSDLFDQRGQSKEITVQLKDKSEKTLFYDIDGWLKIRGQKPKEFSWPLFSESYPVHLILRPDYFSEYSRYKSDFKYQGESVPPEAIVGLVISLDLEKFQDKSIIEKNIIREKLSRRTYIPERYQISGQVKEIKREVLIRFVRSLLKRLFAENPAMAMPIYDEKGQAIFPKAKD